MYLCWMLEKRLLKFTDPKKEPTNWTFINNEKESLLANKIEWHGERPSTLDEARVYLFDELCGFWEDWSDSSTELSRFLFEKTLSFYLDFMKADTLLSESCMTHHFVHYDTAVFSSDLLQRILSVFSDMLHLELDAYPIELNVNSQIQNDVSNITTDEQYIDFLQKIYDFCFQESEDRIRTISNSKRKIQTNRKEFLKKVHRVVKEKPMLEDFKRIMFLNSKAYGAWYQEEDGSGTEWARQFYKWFMDLCACVDFNWQIQIKPESENSSREVKEYIMQQLREDELHFMLNASVLLYSKAARDDTIQKLVLLSKKMFFYDSYSDKQYQNLLDFCI